MSGFPSSNHVRDAVRDLPMSLPYHRLFGTHFVPDDDGGAFRGARRRTRELERT
ncbi:MAG TPA: hypothetical protein VFV63_10210 [Ilumatobacteraceae bacterium]|nr:hypothetical protein [Ilumatobacteraceae bacterium]